MNKKGFMFIETIVTLTILMSLLLVLYTVFVNLLQKAKVGAEYDKYGDRMALWYAKEKMLDSPGGLSEVKTEDDSLNISELLVQKCENIKIYNLDSLNSAGFKKYVSQYKNNGCESDRSDDDFIILGKLKHNNTYTYAHIYYPTMEED